ncbi:Pantothenate kinase 4 [Thelohanellus kitauei]|uniref:4'-phosphopantetheine phosphatase n=1 Tax=Thelohanellus kitauei TaxID=669202 RepID=A0A0C2MTS0_THEKT|nr:Pantothenate kinase 4 [Thelohanellus kitauei]
MKTNNIDSIKYPVNLYGDVKHARRIALDIGGSLAKLVYVYESNKKQGSDDAASPLDFASLKPMFQMRFVAFETKYIETCLDFIQKLYLNKEMSLTSNVVFATGGGSVKYANLIKNKLGLELQKEDEIDCAVKGSIFLIKNIKNECFEFDKEHFPCFTYQICNGQANFPFLLANVGSGVSFIKVESSDKYERVGGTQIGGATFWGLGSQMTDSSGYADLLQMASDGVSENVDMLVQDIFGGDYELMNLPKTLIASSFGKCARSLQDRSIINKTQFSQKDSAKSLLRMICYNIGHLAVLYARIHNLNRIYFGGHFIQNNYMIILTISESVAFYSQSKIPAIFFKHDGFLGALGAFQNGILREKANGDKSTLKIPDDLASGGFFEENIATSSYGEYSVAKNLHPIKILSLDFDSQATCQFPLLLSGGEMFVDRDFVTEYVEYVSKWVPLFLNEFQNQYEFMDEKFQRLCLNFSEMINKRLDCYKFGNPLKISNYLNDILNIQDRFIRQFLVLDPFLGYKHKQNQIALNSLKYHLLKIDEIIDIKERHTAIFQSMFAGNLIDFSSKEILEMDPSKLEFMDCLNIVKKGKAQIFGGSMDLWIDAFENKKWEKRIFSLIKEFLKIGAHVILAANTYPSFNDVVCSELSLIFNRLKYICPVINQYQERISFVETGFSSSYLNLLAASPSLCETSLGVDLIIVEGHSRSLVGFLGAEFTCDVVYLGTVTSDFFAKRCGMSTLDTFIKFKFL